MDTKVNYTIVGIFVVVLSIAFAITALWLTTKHGTGQYDRYIVIMNEAVSGLNIRSPVKFNGVQVGSIEAINLNPKNPQQVQLLVQIRTGTPITTSTVATLMAQGITGITYLGLKALTPDAPPLVSIPGQPYPVIRSVPSLLVELDTLLRDVTADLTRLSQSFQRVFDQENIANFKSTLTNLTKVSQALATNSQSIGESVRNLNVLLKNSSRASEQFPQTMANINKMASNVGQAGSSAKTVIQNISDQMVPNATRILNRLNAITENLQQFSNELQQNPSVLIRGKAAAPKGPGE